MGISVQPALSLREINAPVTPDYLLPDRLAGVWDVYFRCAATDLFAALIHMPENQLGHLEHAHAVLPIEHLLELVIRANKSLVLRVL